MKKKKIIVRKKKEVSGLKKIASFTSQSIKSAHEGYNKSQKVKRLEIERLEKVSQKKEQKLKKEQKVKTLIICC